MLAGLVGDAGGRRAFVDATGTPVVPPPRVRRVVATDDAVGALLRDLGAPLVGGTAPAAGGIGGGTGGGADGVGVGVDGVGSDGGVGADGVGAVGVGVDGVAVVGAARAPDPRAVAGLRPDLIVTGAVAGAHDLVDRGLVERLRRVAPVVAVDTGRPAVAAADLRALLGPAVGGVAAATRPVADERVGAPLPRPPRPT